MSEKLQKELLCKLKRKPCEQEECRSRNEDNVEVIVFGGDEETKGGLMCSGCLLDSVLLNSLQPIERHAMSIREYLRILTREHGKYHALRSSQEWGPSAVGKAVERLRQKQEALYDQTINNALEIKHYFDEATSQAQEQLKKAHLDPDFQKLGEFLGEDSEEEQDRAVVAGQLGRVSRGVRMREGKVGYSSEERVRKVVQEVVGAYGSKVAKAAEALRELLQVQRECHRSLLW